MAPWGAVINIFNFFNNKNNNNNNSINIYETRSTLAPNPGPLFEKSSVVKSKLQIQTVFPLITKNYSKLRETSVVIYVH